MKQSTEIFISMASAISGEEIKHCNEITVYMFAESPIIGAVSISFQNDALSFQNCSQYSTALSILPKNENTVEMEVLYIWHNITGLHVGFWDMDTDNYCQYSPLSDDVKQKFDDESNTTHMIKWVDT